MVLRPLNVGGARASHGPAVEDNQLTAMESQETGASDKVFTCWSALTELPTWPGCFDMSHHPPHRSRAINNKKIKRSSKLPPQSLFLPKT